MEDHKTFAVDFEKELLIQKQKENYLKARQILSDKQNTVGNLQSKIANECEELEIISRSFQSFVEDGDLDAFMDKIKGTQYFGKRCVC